MRYIIFSRVSTEKQTTKNQLWECRNYVDSIKKLDDEVLEFDEPETSTRLSFDERPVLMSMLESVKRNDTLIVYTLSRLARAGDELIDIYINRLTKKGVNVISLSEPKVDKNIVHVYAMVAGMERDTISKNTKSGLMRKQACMEKVGTCWYGYKTDEGKLQERSNVRSTGKPYLLIPDPDEQRNLDLMIDLRKHGESYQDIANELANRGYMNRKGNRFQKNSVYRILSRIERLNQAPKDSLAIASH